MRCDGSILHKQCVRIWQMGNKMNTWGVHGQTWSGKEQSQCRVREDFLNFLIQKSERSQYFLDKRNDMTEQKQSLQSCPVSGKVRQSYTKRQPELPYTIREQSPPIIRSVRVRKFQQPSDASEDHVSSSCALLPCSPQSWDSCWHHKRGCVSSNTSSLKLHNLSPEAP